ncbi:hypothetical protein Pint_22828 [Pistacia integerrima]|uniref:Uncharacterized protein n=1 Tax=Pistacia integerrima TaxID=434235 RepID=A0ACC0YGE2_9ROSI|nr:hypothetical protein Pint_22828 [Pistacia integerrima]
MYLTSTRPDIMHAVSLISRYMENPTEIHLLAAKRIFRYLKGTADFGILYKKGGESNLIGFSDSDYVGDIDDRKNSCQAIWLRRLLEVLHIQQQSPTLIYCDNIYAIKLSKIQFYIEGASILMRDITPCVIYARMVLLIWCFVKVKIRLQIFRLTHSSLLCL